MATHGLLARVLTGRDERFRPKPPARSAVSASWLRRSLAPALLLATTPLLTIVIWMICAHFDGSTRRFVETVDRATFIQLFPRPTWSAARIIALWVIAQGLMLRLLPGRSQLGPVTPTGEQPRYVLNGVPAWLITHVALVGAWSLGLFRASDVYGAFGSILVTLTLAALLFCGFLYWKGRTYPSTRDAVYTGHFLFDFFQGVELHPSILGMNLKQLMNCRVSMMGWSVLLLCFAGYQYETYGRLSSSMAVSTGLVVAYLFKFFVWEGGYFQSLDIMHDRFGYYICWGVLVWVPSVYTVFGQYLANHPIVLHPLWAATLVVVGLASLLLNYAADAQRQRVRATGGATTVWGKPPKTVIARYRTADGVNRENLLLASGYWGISRHFHYLPELSIALCWSLPAGCTALPYFYVVFLMILLVDRANRDDARCRAKYGPSWEEYCRLVPYKILPGVY